jgi:hypothetical protein
MKTVAEKDLKKVVAEQITKMSQSYSIFQDGAGSILN